MSDPPGTSPAASDGVARLEVRALSRDGLQVEPFVLAAGECVAVRGPSGSGKSLLMRAIADLDPNEGELLVDGAARSTVAAPRWRRLVTYLPAESGWWEERVRGHFGDRPAAVKLAMRLGLPEDCMDWPMTRLSTGERQRLALVRALVNGPRVLLADEPTSALDDDTVSLVEQVLIEWLAAGGACLLVSHDGEQTARMARRQLRVASGRVREVTA